MSFDQGTWVQNSGNGYDADLFSWTQNKKEINVRIRVYTKRNEAKPITSKDIIFKVDKGNNIFVVVDDTIIISGILFKKVRSDDVYYTIETEKSGTYILATIFKIEQELWSSLLESDTKLDSSKFTIEETKLYEMDDEERAIAEKLLYEQRTGKFTSSKQIDYNLVEKIKKANPLLFK